MSKKDKDIALFVAFCIEEYGAAKGMTGEQVLDLFSQYGVTDYLSMCQKSLTVQGFQWFTKELQGFILNRLKHKDDTEQINQSNIHLLLPGKISWLVEYLHDDYGFTLQECLNRIYHSKLYKKLADESTKYWHLGPVDLYEELKTEL